MNKIPTDIMKELVIPHIGLTTYKYRAVATNLIKRNKCNISIDQFITLKLLMDYNGISQQDLANMIYKDKSNFSRIADDLEKKCLITRELDTKDNRVIKKLFITENGEQTILNFFPIAKSLHDNALKDIPKDELEIMKKVLGKIRDNLDNINMKELR